MSNNKEYQRRYREKMREAGVGEVRGINQPKENHSEVKELVKRHFGEYKVKK